MHEDGEIHSLFKIDQINKLTIFYFKEMKKRTAWKPQSIQTAL